ncbi:hypothetical protein OAC91_00135 [Candidatus Marinimicrobia bacterium]|nr:hypothetical protein [Candidatus Neomarinimicrobiota bacterium]
MKKIITIFFDFIWYSWNKIFRIFSFGLFTITLLTIILIVFLYLIVTGIYDPIPLIVRWLS